MSNKQNSSTGEKIPTISIYSFFQMTYQYFNEQLFDNMLSNCIITFQREKNVMGYFSSQRWADKKGVRIHEIALNPSYFITEKPLEFFQTLVHEMTHLWQD